jgi:hypothetical protein
MLLCLHGEQPASGSEEGGSRYEILKISLCYVVFVHRCWAREHIAVIWIKCDVSLGHQMLYSK